MNARLPTLMTVAVLSSCGGEASWTDDESLATESEQGLSRKIRGDSACVAGAPDCNVCVNDVVATVERGFGGRFDWNTHEWTFTWERAYPPNDVKPLSVFHDGKSLLEMPTHHVQGFARTNSERIPFIVTHSDDVKGGIGRINADGRLATLLLSNDNHPSGGQVLGNSFLFAEGSMLRVINVVGPAADQRLAFPMPDWAAPGSGLSGGGLGAVKLRDGRTLVISSTPGGDEAGPRRTLFFAKAGAINDATPLMLIGETVYSQPDGWKDDYRRSENLSVITECGTGNIFTLHVTGDRELEGRGYYRLSRVDTVDGKPQLTTLRAYGMDQSIWNCHLRSSGTAFARADHTLGLVCHEFLARRGLFGWNDEGEFSYRMTK